jgi:hypothetical protein
VAIGAACFPSGRGERRSTVFLYAYSLEGKVAGVIRVGR